MRVVSIGKALKSWMFTFLIARTVYPVFFLFQNYGSCYIGRGQYWWILIFTGLRDISYPKPVIKQEKKKIKPIYTLLSFHRDGLFWD